MKLRIRGNSLRLRLDRTEIDQLAATGAVEGTTSFGAGTALAFVIQRREQSVTLAAEITGSTIRVFIRPDDVNALASTEIVGFEAEQPLGDGGTLRLLIEKDFACLTHRIGEDDTHAYDNPKSHCEPA